jgi:NitT/TauT family transport system substrate-binding protein
MARVHARWAGALALVLAAWAVGHRPSPGDAAQGVVKLRVSCGPFLSHAPFFIAAEEGLFRAEGLDVELVRNTSHDAILALAQGEVDAAAPLLSAGIFNAMARGTRLQIVADKGHAGAASCAAAGLLVSQALAGGVGDLSRISLKGLRVGFRKGTVEEYVVERMLEGAGLVLGEVRSVEIPAGVKLDALASGGLDLAFSSEPWITRAVRSGVASLWLPLQRIVPDQQWSVVVFGRRLLDREPDVGRRFAIAYLRAVRRFREGKTDRNVAIIARHTGLDEKLTRACCWFPISADGEIDVASVMEFQHWAVSHARQDAIVDEQAFWNPTFVRRARVELLGSGAAGRS